jgi:hypothetical protein
LSFFPPNVQPDYDELSEGIQSNPDGCGFALVLDDGTLVVEKAIGVKEQEKRESKATPGTHYMQTVINVDACYDLALRFCALRKENPTGPAMFHSRFATGGVEDTRGCHPFDVNWSGAGADPKTVLGHNGVFFSPHAGDWRSDTRIFAEVLMPDILKGIVKVTDPSDLIKAKFHQPASLWSKRGTRKIESYLGGGNKVAIITVNPDAMSPAARAAGAPWEYKIYNEDAGIWTRDGAWHSNTGYIVPRRSAYTGATWDYQSGEWTRKEDGTWSSNEGSWASGAPDTCGLGTQFRDAEEGASERENVICCLCGQPRVDIVTLLCAACDSCQDCYMTASECSCFTPAGSKVPARNYDDDDGGWQPEWMRRMLAQDRALLDRVEDDDSNAAYSPAICSPDEKEAAHAAFKAGELSYGEFLELTCGESWGCACQSWCGESGCLPDDDITFTVEVLPNVYEPMVGDRVRLDIREWPKGVSTVIVVEGDRVSLQSEGKGSITSDSLANWRRAGIKLVMRPAKPMPDLPYPGNRRGSDKPMTQDELEQIADDIASEVLARADGNDYSKRG